MPVLRLLQANGRIPCFAAAMLVGGLANGLFFFVLWRMKKLGRSIGVWRSMGKDFALYRGYWRVALRQNWSRAPLVIGPLSFVMAGFLMWMSIRGIHIPR